MIREQLTKAHKSDGGQIDCFQTRITEESIIDGWIKRPHNQDHDSGVVECMATGGDLKQTTESNLKYASGVRVVPLSSDSLRRDKGRLPRGRIQQTVKI